uniref:Uncharacterized protein n=1 Tax=Kalanchoe fedtschenkoi TaxID=63787 RepID=A0A7N1A6U0_KALFE
MYDGVVRLYLCLLGNRKASFCIQKCSLVSSSNTRPCDRGGKISAQTFFLVEEYFMWLDRNSFFLNFRVLFLDRF